ncbi:MAG: RNA polymerase factor sigma-54, partial [Campylobacterales bacterium]|nr:RNA polymerase factor sigma-54 [Campylobacterales bacterium]
DEYDYYRKNEEHVSTTDTIEAITFNTKSLYDTLEEQITDDLFPTPMSQTIAYEIIRFINEDGFFDGCTKEIAKSLKIKEPQVEGIRQRFERLDPIGVGSKDIAECFMFQLREQDPCEEIYQLAKEMIHNLDSISKFHKKPNFSEAIALIKKFKNPPAIEFSESSAHVVPDIFVFSDGDNLTVSLNDDYYPDIVINDYGMDNKNDYVKEKLKEARDLVDAIDMRKKTLYNIGMMIVEYQYDFFKGGEIKPLKLVDISEDLGRNPSTISRAISEKYLACDRGVLSLKSFFSVSIEDTSTKSIKDYILKLIKEEPKNKPLSDQKIVDKVQEHFKLKMVRRTITKYREQLNIPKSGERKREYLLQ